MKSLDVGVLLVQQKDEIVGTATGRDIIVEAVAEELDTEIATLEQNMAPEMSISLASCWGEYCSRHVNKRCIWTYRK
jgi:hypothetical protein